MSTFHMVQIYSMSCHVEKREILSHQKKKFRQINSLVTSLVKLLSTFTKFLPKTREREFPYFPQSTFHKMLSRPRFLREIKFDYFLTFFYQ